MKAEILCVGTELLLGDIVNTNAVYIAKELARMGVNVYHQSVVGDNSQRLRESLSRALRECDIVVTTGGLGPTYDDLTKETAAALFGREMELNEESLHSIEAFFKKIGRPMTENNKKQAMMPKGAVVLQNASGTAPGLILEGGGKTLILLPGPPREMQPMFTNQVVPYLLQKSHTTLRSKNIHIFGMGEAQVEELLRDMMESHQNPTIAPYAKDGEVLLRVTASAEKEDAALKLIDPVVNQISSMLAPYIYGIDVGSLQNALVLALTKQGLKVATAESCTGGLLSHRITEVPGASMVFDCGVCSYANDIKESLLSVSHNTLSHFGAVSKQTACEMAAGIRKLAKADIGLSTTGIAGPGGGSDEKPVGLVYVAVDSEWHREVIELKLSRGYPDERRLIQYLAASHALYMGLRTAQKYEKKNHN